MKILDSGACPGLGPEFAGVTFKDSEKASVWTGNELGDSTSIAVADFAKAADG